MMHQLLQSCNIGKYWNDLIARLKARAIHMQCLVDQIQVQKLGPSLQILVAFRSHKYQRECETTFAASKAPSPTTLNKRSRDKDLFFVSFIFLHTVHFYYKVYILYKQT